MFGGMALIAEFHRPDIGIVPIGDRFTMGARSAAFACKKFFSFEMILPCHYGTFPGMLDPKCRQIRCRDEGSQRRGAQGRPDRHGLRAARRRRCEAARPKRRRMRACPIPARRHAREPRRRRRCSRGAPPGSRHLAGAGPGVVLWAYTLTTFLSALLLFSIQPMFAKMVLPVLGGSPSVWAVAVFFFQAALLAGYCYAHFLINKAPPPHDRASSISASACWRSCCCRSGCRRSWGEPPPGEPYLWQLGLFTVADRPAVPGRVGQRAAAAGVVRAHRASARQRSLLPLRGEQSRQPDRAAGLSRSCWSPRSA